MCTANGDSPPSSPQIVFVENLSDKEAKYSHLSASNTDAFSLNTFEELIDEHSQLCIEGNPDERRRLIIARVRTWDQTTRRYFDSYYDAWHLNKILFRAQSSSNRSYIHRLLVADPMTNAEIIKVEYFKTGDASLHNGLKYLDCINSGLQTISGTTVHGGNCPAKLMSNVTPTDSRHMPPNNSQLIPSSVIAYYVGSDIDYMKSKALRSCFRKNAIAEEDAELFLLQPHDRGRFLAERDWTRLLGGNNDHQHSTLCSSVDTLLKAVGVLFCCVLFYVQIEEEDEYGLEQQQGLIDEAEPVAEAIHHDYWQPVSAVQDLTLTHST